MKYYKIIFSDYSETTGKQTSKSAMMKDARHYCKIWNLSETVKEVIEISEAEYIQAQRQRKEPPQMEKNTFFVIEIQDNSTGKTAARAQKVNNKYNLVGLFTPAKGYTLLSVNACDTWKEAENIARFWNECARQKNNCMY